MPLKPHKDLIKGAKKNLGYAIRIGDKVPKNSANLAYVQSRPVSPEENILMEDFSSHIKENGLATFVAKDYMVYPDEKFMLETEEGQFDFPTQTVSVTDEFTVRKHRQDVVKPVFYRMILGGRFDARSAEVLPYIGGYSPETEKDAIAFTDVNQEKREELLYVGNSIRIEANGAPLGDDEVYKIMLIRESNFVYRISVYTNFQNSAGVTYKIIYPNYRTDVEQTELAEEVLNAAPFFERTTPELFDEVIAEMELEPDTYKHLKVYTVKENGNNFNIFATSDVLIANLQTRAPQVFKHRVEAKLKTKLSETNKGKVRVGFYFVQEVANVENLNSTGKDLNENALVPKYLELINPHPTFLGAMKKDMSYWLVDFNMPEHHYEDYDLIVITGYGKTDLSQHKKKLEHYLKNGGTIWVDNAGSQLNVLDFKTSAGNSFVSDISFSGTSNEFGIKEQKMDSPFLNRLFSITKTDGIGYPNTAPSILYGLNEEAAQWDVLVKHLNGGPSVIQKSVYEKGTLLVSNCGIFRGVYHNQPESVYMVLNTLLDKAEQKWILTPWRNEFVYHRDNLFLQEYKFNNREVYINDRSDYNQNEIVAKKILANSMKEFVKAYCEPSFYDAVGSYHHQVDGHKSVTVNNNGFESGRVDSNGAAVTSWTASTVKAIPGWNTKTLAGVNATYRHDAGISLYGVRQVSIDSTDGVTGAHTFWESDPLYLPADDYKASVWISTDQVRGITTNGAKIGIYNVLAEQITSSIALTNKTDWTKVEIEFHIDKPQEVNLRLGFVDGNGFGKISFDHVEMNSLGTVKGVIENEGEKALYVFSTKPNATTIDIEAEGFGDADITRATPQVAFSYTLAPFVYVKTSLGFDTSTGLEIVRYDPSYGAPVSYLQTIRKTEGLKNLGFLHTLLPPVPSGKEWYDKNKIFYKISLGSENQQENNLVNLKLFDRKTGMEWFYSDELIIGHRDIFAATINPSFVLHAETGYETIRASKRNFGLKLVDDQRIYAELPQTKDAKENWYLRIHNGQFVKNGLEYKEWLELHKNEDPELLYQYKERVMPKETYSINEYAKQIFNPSVGIMTVENEMEYQTPSIVKVPHNQLHVNQGSMVKDQMTVEGLANSVGTLFRAHQKDWLRNENVHIYLDALNDGNQVEVFEEQPYEINFEEGTVFFPGQHITGKAYASYDYRNFKLYKRVYENARVTDDLLGDKRYDTAKKEYILYGSKTNWMVHPVPVLKSAKGKATASTIIPATNYRIDHERGMVVFLSDPTSAIYVDYSYFEDQELSVKDYDTQNGLFILNENVSFKDDLYARYSYYDNFYEYKGFFNEALGKFLHLDLNPSVGHYSTLPMTTYIKDVAKVEYRNTASSKLLNKSIHIYMVPDSEKGNSIRHCFSAEEWRIIQRSNPMYLLLAKVQVREHTNVNEVVVMDARVRGGGISEKLSTKVIDDRIKGKQRYWDIGNWDGKAFYRNGVLIIKLPKSILIEYGGNLSEEYVKESIDKHVAYGTYCIIEWE